MGSITGERLLASPSLSSSDEVEQSETEEVRGSEGLLEEGIACFMIAIIALRRASTRLAEARLLSMTLITPL